MRPAARTLGSVVEIAGLLVLVMLVGWVLLVAEAKAGDGSTISLLLGGVGLAYLLARLISVEQRWGVPAVIALGSAGFAIVRRDVLLGGPLEAPLGYSNAAGSLFMLAAGAAFLVVARVKNPGVRLAAASLGVLFALVPILNHTAAATVLVLLIPAGLMARSRTWARRAVIGAAGATGAAVVASVALGVLHRPGVSAPWIDATIGLRRLDLWHEAFVLFRANPLTGVGPLRFPHYSPTAQIDPDTIWPHNEYFHFAAETGIIGAALFLLLFGLGFARLWMVAVDSGSAVAALALAAAGIHASVDYVLHYPAIPIAAAALLGAGATAPATRAVRQHRGGVGHRRGSSRSVAGANRLDPLAVLDLVQPRQSFTAEPPR